jgi:hypothetical protein
VPELKISKTPMAGINGGLKMYDIAFAAFISISDFININLACKDGNIPTNI